MASFEFGGLNQVAEAEVMGGGHILALFQGGADGMSGVKEGEESGMMPGQLHG